MKLQSNSGNTKGFIFSMDALFALIIVIIFLTISNIYINRIEFSSISDLQLIKRSNDLFKIIDEKADYGTKFIFLTNNSNFKINETLRDIIVAAGGDDEIPNIDFDMQFTARCYNYTQAGLFNLNSNFTSSQTVPKDRFIAAGQRIFVIPNKTNVLSTYYCIGEQRSWLK